ncbi:hypothetical protein GOP47_0014903 [Adiantum capillus-veneris]|uniref:Uncharacterized protein n=1 Tax=Adiantum capillus-veneris TaxID=13818 RepID=A0A9D4UMC7_ADICA|nr:hypothetical protein GOP47_0014903 [Adiantum capillus-veneris]
MERWGSQTRLTRDADGRETVCCTLSGGTVVLIEMGADRSHRRWPGQPDCWTNESPNWLVNGAKKGPLMVKTCKAVGGHEGKDNRGLVVMMTDPRTQLIGKVNAHNDFIWDPGEGAQYWDAFNYGTACMRGGAEIIARGNALGRCKAKPKGLGSFARLDRQEVKRPVLLLMDQKVMTRMQATDGRWISPREKHAGRTGDEQDKHESRGLVITRTGTGLGAAYSGVASLSSQVASADIEQSRSGGLCAGGSQSPERASWSRKPSQLGAAPGPSLLLGSCGARV